MCATCFGEVLLTVLDARPPTEHCGRSHVAGRKQDALIVRRYSGEG